MPTERWANNASTTLTVAVSTTPAAGTVETWTVAATTTLPQTVGQTRLIVDSEIVIATTPPASGTTISVTRGAESSTIATHAAGAPVTQIVTAEVLDTLETTTGAQSKVDTHAADTTAIHGIADAALLETTAGAQAKANAAVAAIDYTTVQRAGPLASRPAAASNLAGITWLVTDGAEGNYETRCNGTSWELGGAPSAIPVDKRAWTNYGAGSFARVLKIMKAKSGDANMVFVSDDAALGDGSNNEVQTITQGGTGLTSYTLTFSGQTTASIAQAATAATVQAELEALSNIGVGDVVVTGAAGGPYVVNFAGALANTDVAQMTAITAGGFGVVTIYTAIPGGTAVGWVYQLADKVRLDWPGHTVHYVPWNPVTNTYDAAQVLQTGTDASPKIIRFYNASFANAGWHDFSKYTSLMFVATTAVVFCLGAYDKTAAGAVATVGTMRERAIPSMETIRAANPFAQTTVASQWPFISPDVTGNQGLRASTLHGLSHFMGLGFVDIHQAFLDAGPDAFVTSATQLPNATGITLMRDTFYDGLFRYQAGVGVRPEPPSLLASNPQFTNLVPNGDFIQWPRAHAGDPPAGWTADQCTVTKETTIWETKGYSVKLAAEATLAGTGLLAGSGVYVKLLDATTIIPFRGKRVTALIRVYIPTASTTATVGLGGLGQTAAMTQGNTAGATAAGFDTWRWHVVSRTIGDTDTELFVKVFAITANTANTQATTVVYVDRVIVTAGALPKDLPNAGLTVGGTRLARQATKAAGTIALTTTLASLSTTLLRINFTMPVSGKVTACIQALVGLENAAGSVSLGIIEDPAGTPVTRADILVLSSDTMGAAETWEHLVNVEDDITGTPGALVTWDLAAKFTGAGAAAFVRSAAGNPATIIDVVSA